MKQNNFPGTRITTIFLLPGSHKSLVLCVYPINAQALISQIYMHYAELRKVSQNQ